MLEVAPGPGYLSIELAKLGKCRVSGLDISETFVRIERQNAKEAGVEVDFRHGDATTMPFENDAFDFAVCVAAFKNFSCPDRALNEFHRVLKPGGTALISDLRSDASIEDIDAEVRKMKLNPVNSWLTKWTFKHILLKNAYTRAKIQTLVKQTDFQNCDIRSDLIGMEIWLEKLSSATDPSPAGPFHEANPGRRPSQIAVMAIREENSIRDISRNSSSAYSRQAARAQCAKATPRIPVSC